MRFQTILEKTVWLLLTEKQVSYQRLRVQFDLDDARLDALRHELIEVKQVAHDQGGEFLVWSIEYESRLPESRAVSAYAPPFPRMPTG